MRRNRQLSLAGRNGYVFVLMSRQPARPRLGAWKPGVRPKTTTAFYVQSAISLAIALVGVAIGIANLPIGPGIRAFLVLGLFYVVTSTFTLAKIVRDHQEVSTVAYRGPGASRQAVDRARPIQVDNPVTLTTSTAAATISSSRCATSRAEQAPDANTLHSGAGRWSWPYCGHGPLPGPRPYGGAMPTTGPGRMGGLPAGATRAATPTGVIRCRAWLPEKCPLRKPDPSRALLVNQTILRHGRACRSLPPLLPDLPRGACASFDPMRWD